MSQDFSLLLIDTLDAIRKEIGLVYEREVHLKSPVERLDCYNS